MIWLRKGVVQFLSLVLLVSLLGGAFATSTNVAFSKPDKVKKWLTESKVYDHFIDNITVQAQKSSANDTSREGSDSVSFSDPVVQQAANSAFSPQLLQQSVNSFLDSNYAWLEGKASTPDFAIDFSEAKETFAQKVGKYAETRLANLPICTNVELAKLPNPANVDALSVNCRPATVDPKAAGAEVTQKLSNSEDFLGNPVITAKTLNPEDKVGQTKPYYEKLSFAPRAYSWGQKLPLILGLLALLSALGIIFIAPLRRRGVRRVGFILLVAGILLLVSKFIFDFAFNKAEGKIFNKASVGELQKSLIDLLHRAQNQLISTDLYFGAAFLVLAAAILFYIFKTRQNIDKPKPVAPVGTPPDDQSPTGLSEGRPQLKPNRPPRSKRRLIQ